MARASTNTWLSLDRWAELFGLDPLHFNQLNSVALGQRDVCGDFWYQYAWQFNNRISREDIAFAIQQAEQKLASFIGYDLLPSWHVDEEVRTVQPYRAEIFSTGVNLRGLAKSVRMKKGYVISTGKKIKDLVEANVVVTRTDDDGDGYKELVSLSVAAPSNACQLHVYLPTMSGDDRWEVRPIKVSVSGATATITFKSWQLVVPDLFEKYTAKPIDADDDTNYLDMVDVYRVYNDPSDQVTFLWENPATTCYCGSADCQQCTLAAQSGCMDIRDYKLAYLGYHPADWDADTSSFTPKDYWTNREPDKMLVSYLAGWQGEGVDCPMTDLDPFWEKTIAFLSAALMDKEICTCDNITRFVGHWQQDLAFIDPAQGSFLLTQKQQNNPFGTTRGGIYAFNNCLQDGRSIAV